MSSQRVWDLSTTQKNRTQINVSYWNNNTPSTGKENTDNLKQLLMIERHHVRNSCVWSVSMEIVLCHLVYSFNLWQATHSNPNASTWWLSAWKLVSVIKLKYCTLDNQFAVSSFPQYFRDVIQSLVVRVYFCTRPTKVHKINRMSRPIPHIYPLCLECTFSA